MRIFNELQGSKYDELTAPYEKFLPEYFGKLGEAYKVYPEAVENEEYNLYVYYNKWPIRKLEYSYVISKMQESIFEGAKVLDAGCGVSSMPFLWSELGGEVTAVDFDEKSIAMMNKFNNDTFFGEGRPISTAVCDIMNLPYEDNTFDVVVCTSVLEHLPYPNYLLAINELYRVLKQDGTLVCTCDLDASEGSKRRAVGAFSVKDIQKILAEFEDELVREELDVEQLSITEEEIEQFWLKHHYDGIGYEGNRGYVAVGFRIKKNGSGDKKEQLLQYNEMIRELMNYESYVVELQMELQKGAEYARQLEAEGEERLQQVQKLSVESEERLQQMQKLSAESEERLQHMQKMSVENEERLQQLQELTAENEKRLEAIEYLKAQIEEKDKIIQELSKDE